MCVVREMRETKNEGSYKQEMLLVRITRLLFVDMAICQIFSDGIKALSVLI